MISRSICSNQSTRAVKCLVRFQSTTVAQQVEKKTESNPSRRNDGRQKNQFTSSLYSILDEEFVEFSPYFEQIKSAFEKGSEKDKNKAINSMHALSSKMFSKVLDIKQKTNTDVSTSILFKEIIGLLVENKILPAGSFNRYIEILLSEKKYMAALTFWIENANYFKFNPKAFPNARKDSAAFKNNSTEVQKDPFVERNYHLNGLTAYLASLIENKDLSIDPEFIKLIFGDKKPVSYNAFSNFVSRLDINEADARIIKNLYFEFMSKSLDINSTESLKGIRLASLDGKLVYLNEAITKNLEAFKGRESEIKPETIAHYMKYLNIAKLYSRSIEIWRFASQHKIPMDISIWNQLLDAFAHLNIADTQNKVASVWNLIKKSAKPDSQTYTIYVSFLLKNKQVDKVKELLESIKKESPELFDSSLKCSMVEVLLASDKVTEAHQLFKIYQKQDDFVPNIQIYNKLLGKLLAAKDYEATQELLNELLSNKYASVQPDTATWTTIVDFLLKSSAKSNLSKEEIVSNIFSIIKSMEASGVKLNNVALMTVASNLLKNPSTQELGMEFFQNMEHSGIKLNAVAYTGIITTFAARGETANALEYYNKALKNGILPAAFLYNSILKGYSNSPDVEATREFMKKIKDMIKANPQNQKILPNKYTYYFLLLQGVRVKDARFVNEILEDLSKSTAELSDALLKILSSLKESGYTIPENLAIKLKD